MAHLDLVKHQCFCDSFRAASEDINKVLSNIRAASSDVHWMTRSEFCGDVALNPLIFSYQDPVPILNAFYQQNRTGFIAPSVHIVFAWTVEDSSQCFF